MRPLEHGRHESRTDLSGPVCAANMQALRGRAPYVASLYRLPNGRAVAVHTGAADGCKQAIRCGARSLEHAYLIDAEGIEMARYLMLAPEPKRVYDAHNPEFLLQRRLSEAGSSTVAGVYSRLQWRRC